MDRSFRILKWYLLLHAYAKKRLDIWYSQTDKDEKLFISSIQPGPSFRNIREFEKVRSETIPNVLVRWLVTRHVPNAEDKDSLFAIVRENKPHYEIAGFCRKDRPKMASKLLKRPADFDGSPELEDEHECCSDDKCLAIESLRNSCGKVHQKDIVMDTAERRKRLSNGEVQGTRKRIKLGRGDIDVTKTAKNETTDTISSKKDHMQISLENAHKDKHIKLGHGDNNVSETTKHETTETISSKKDHVRVSLENTHENNSHLAPEIKKEIVYTEDSKPLSAHSHIQDRTSPVTTNSDIIKSTKNTRALYHCHNFPIKLLRSDNEIVEATLPTILPTCRWRGLIIPNDFKELRISKVVRITNEVVRQMQEISRAKDTTIQLALGAHFSRSEFSVYFPHIRSDMMYIGPYTNRESHSLTVHTELNPKVSVERFYGKWYRENSETIIMETVEKNDVVDSINEQDGVRLLNKDGSRSGITLTPNMKIIAAQQPKQIKINQTVHMPPKSLTTKELVEPIASKSLLKPKSLMPKKHVDPVASKSLLKNATVRENVSPSIPTEVDDELAIVEENRKSRQRKYIITNIPDLGYLLGYQFTNSKIVDILCPFGRVTKRFSNINAAALWLRK